MRSKTLENYIIATELLIEEFYKKYYWDESDGEYQKHPDDWYAIGGYRDQWPDMVWIGDEIWSITDIYTALVNDMDHDLVWTWYDYNTENYGKEWWTNLWHWHLKSIKKPLYTQEDIERSERAVKKAKEIFHNAIKECGQIKKSEED